MKFSTVHCSAAVLMDTTAYLFNNVKQIEKRVLSPPLSTDTGMSLHPVCYRSHLITQIKTVSDLLYLMFHFFSNFVLLHVFLSGLGESFISLFAALDITFLGEVCTKIINLKQ